MCAFRMKYEIEIRYLTGPSKRRPMTPMQPVRFLVAHDTGNPGSTANGNIGYFEATRNDMYASAHTFVDDRHIIECIPLLTGTPEQAWHVVYEVENDNNRYGDDANDAAGSIELCYGGSIHIREAYRRYVWYFAYACYRFGLDTSSRLTGHYLLDPRRKNDPQNAFALLGISFERFVRDVAAEYEECYEEEEEDDMALREEVEALKSQVEALRARASMPQVPEWARSAVDAAVASGLIDTPEGGSYDFYRLLTVLHRKGVI